MIDHRLKQLKRLMVLASGFALIVGAPTLQAQDAAAVPAKSPAKQAPAKKGAAPGAADPAAVDPAAAVAAGKSADPAAPVGAPAKAPPVPDVPANRPPDAATQTILDSNPKTPSEMVQAVISLTALDHPELAKPLLQQLVAAKIDPDTAADLIHQFGSAAFIGMAGDKRLRPESEMLSSRVLAAASAQIHDPARLAGWVQKLGDPSADVQRAAVAALHDGGEFSVPPLLAVLVNPAQQKIHSLARSAVVGLGAVAIPPLAAALQAPEPAIKIQAIELLADLGETKPAVYLLLPYLAADSPVDVRQAAGEALQKLVNTLPTLNSATELLTRETRAYLAGERIVRPDLGDAVIIWNWDPATKQLTGVAYPQARAASFIAARLASDLYDLAPNSREARRLHLISLLESSVYRGGLDKPLPLGPGSTAERVTHFGIDAINDALSQALTTSHPRAAQGAAQILGEIGNKQLLTRDGATPCPLAAALLDPDRRVRLAAASAIMRFKPNEPFAGSSYLTETAAYFATGMGRHRVAIGFPTTHFVGQIAGLAGAAGWEPATALEGHDLMIAAAESADTELVLVSGRIQRPIAFDLVQQMRQDPRTAKLPIGIMAEVGDRYRLEQLFVGIPRAFILPRPEQPAEMQAAINTDVELAGDSLIPAPLRVAQAATALDWLAELAAVSPQVFDVRRFELVAEQALYAPATAPHAAAVLARLGTHTSQRALVNLASRQQQPLDVRQLVAAAFEQSVHHFGVRLAPSEIVQQYDRYNQSAQMDKATQQLLGRILDVIEGPKKKP